MGHEGEQIDLDFSTAAEDQKLQLANGISELISHIEGSLTDAHLAMLILQKSEQVLGNLSADQRRAINDYVETHKSYQHIVPQELASEILDIAA
jgi:hypothetical protein